MKKFLAALAVAVSLSFAAVGASQAGFSDGGHGDRVGVGHPCTSNVPRPSNWCPPVAPESVCGVNCDPGGGQTCSFALWLAPNTWYANLNPCGNNNWKSIYAYFDFPPPPSACTAAVGLDASGVQAARCNEGNAEGHWASGLYGGTFGYNTSPLWVYVTGYVSTV